MSYSTHSIEDHGLDASGIEALEAAHQCTVSSAEHAMRVNAEVGYWFVKGVACHRACLDRSLTRASLHVFAVLTQHMRATHHWGWPSYETIQRETGLSEESVRRAIKELRDHGYLLTTKKAPPQGGRALVHYGMGSVVDMIRDYLDDYRNLTPTAMLGSADLTPTNLLGSDASAETAHPNKTVGVRVSDPNKFVGVRPEKQADPNNSDASIDIIGGPISKRDGVLPIATEVNPPFKKEDLFSDTEVSNDPCCDIEFPALLKEAIDAGTAPAAVRNFIDAVKRARRRKIAPSQIEMVCSKAVTKVCEETGEREPSPSALLGKATRYLLHTEAEATITVPRVPLPTDGQGAWEYSIGRAKWIGGLKRSVEIETLNGWIADANTQHGSRIARMRDCEAVISEITCDDEIVSMILWAAIKRVHGYDGGAVPVDPSVINDVLSKHPNVPRDFAKAHVENCYADPAALGMLPRRYNGAAWLAALAKATVERFGIVLERAAKEQAEYLQGYLGSMSVAFHGGNLRDLDIDASSVCHEEWQHAFKGSLEAKHLFADPSARAARAVESVKPRLLAAIDEIARRGPLKVTYGGSHARHAEKCAEARAFVQAIEWRPFARRLEPIAPRQLLKPKPGDLPSIHDGGWEY